MENYIYSISDKSYKIDKNLLGNKGSNLVDMYRLGIPVPEGIVICSDFWKLYKDTSDKNALIKELVKYLDNSYLKNSNNLLSIRSGSSYSMPGMMDTILNIGISSQNIDGYTKIYGEKLAYDCYRRLLESFIISVYGLSEDIVFKHLDSFLKNRNKSSQSDLVISEIIELANYWQDIIKKDKKIFPQSKNEQLEISIQTVLDSWNKPGAITYRRLYGIPEDAGTAVIVQKMVFGNKNENSSTGVFFTRNPMSGENYPFGDLLNNSQGEDIVSGHFQTKKIDFKIRTDLNELI